MSAPHRPLLQTLMALSLALVPTAALAQQPTDATVYVSRNGTRYHGADCPRLRFATPMSASAAREQMDACGVCHGRSLQAASEPSTDSTTTTTTTTTTATATTAEPPARQPAPDPTPSPTMNAPRTPIPATPPVVAKPRSSGHPRLLGAAIGFAAGFAIGYAITEQDRNSSDLYTFSSSSVGLLGGAIGAGIGALVGGIGGSDHFDAALDRERQSLRAQRANRTPDLHVATVPPTRVAQAGAVTQLD